VLFVRAGYKNVRERRYINRGIDPRVGELDLLKICKRGQSMFWPLKCHSFIQNCCWITKFHIIKDKRLVSKMEGKTNFSRRVYRLRGTAKIVDCLEVIEVGCSQKVWWLDLTDPDLHILRQIYATELRVSVARTTFTGHCLKVIRSDTSSTCDFPIPNDKLCWHICRFCFKWRACLTPWRPLLRLGGVTPEIFYP